MNDSQQLRESMWDLVYGLLSDEESEALITRIKSDPDAARLYAEARLEADLVARAARVEDSSIALSTEPKALPPTVEKHVAEPAAATPSAPARLNRDLRRTGTWLAAIGMTALAALLAVGFFWPKPNQQQLAASFLATDLTVPQPMSAGLTNSVNLRTYLVSFGGEATDGAPANVELRLLDRAGNARLQKTIQTNESGQASVELPGDALEPGTRLEVAASQIQKTFAFADQAAQGKNSPLSNTLVANLSVQPEPQMAYFLCAEPTPAADKETTYSIWNFSVFTAKPGPAEVGQAAISAIQDATPSDPASLATAHQNGVVTGKLQVPMLQAADGRSRALNDKQAEIAPVQDFKQQTMLAADQPVPVDIPKRLEGKPLKIAAMNRGVTVAETTLNSAAEETKAVADTNSLGYGANGYVANKAKGSFAAGNQIALAVPPEVEGLIEVDVFDQSLKQNQLAEKQFVYRQPRRSLRIDLPDVKEQYLPGQEVAVTVQCADENGKPAANTMLGVRVWNESAIRQSAEEPVLLADAVTQGVSDVGQDSGATEQRAGKAEAPRPQSYAGYAAPPTATQPADVPSAEFVSNRDAVTAAFREELTHAEMTRQRAIEMIGGAAVIAGIAFLLVIAIFAAMRMSVGWHAMTPTALVAMASVLIGLGWLGWLPSKGNRANVAMAPVATAVPAESAPNGYAPTASSLGRSDSLVTADSRDRAEPGSLTREAAPAVAAGAPAGAPAAGAAAATAPVAPIAAAPMDKSLPMGRATAFEPQAQPIAQPEGAPQVVVGAPEAVRQLVQQRQSNITFQARSGQQAHTLELLKDEDAKSPARQLVEAAGAAGGKSAGRPVTAPGGGTARQQFRFAPQAPAAAKSEPAQRLAGKPGEPVAPTSLYFNPQLMTDAEGKATIHITMPQAESEYRLLIDALGQGRIGSQQRTIVCGPAPAK